MPQPKALIRIGIATLFAALLVGGFEAILRYPNHLWFMIGALLTSVFVYGFVVSEFPFRSIKKIYFPLFLIVAVSACITELLLFSSSEIKQAFIFSHALILGVLFTWFINYAPGVVPTNQQNMEQIRRLAFLYFFFLLFHGLFGLFDLLRTYLWIVMLGGLLSVVCLSIAFLGQIQMLKTKSLFYLLIIIMILTELAWTANLWPIRDTSRSMVLTLVTYTLFVSLLLAHEKKVNKYDVLKQVGFSIIMIMLVMTMSRWTISAASF